MVEMQIPLSQILALVDEGRVETLVRAEGPFLDIEDPDGRLEDLLAAALPGKIMML